jgi:hypothetical protein
MSELRIVDRYLEFCGVVGIFEEIMEFLDFWGSKISFEARMVLGF